MEEFISPHRTLAFSMPLTQRQVRRFFLSTSSTGRCSPPLLLRENSHTSARTTVVYLQSTSSRKNSRGLSIRMGESKMRPHTQRKAVFLDTRRPFSISSMMTWWRASKRCSRRALSCLPLPSQASPSCLVLPTAASTPWNELKQKPRSAQNEQGFLSCKISLLHGYRRDSV